MARSKAQKLKSYRKALDKYLRAGDAPKVAIQRAMIAWMEAKKK